MRTPVLLAVLAALTLPPAFAAEAEKPKDAKPAAEPAAKDAAKEPAQDVPKDERAVYTSGKDEVTGFLALPAAKGPVPGIIVIQEWWGLNDWVKDQARALAREGYAALAVDLYRGKVAAKQEEAHQLMMGLPDERAAQDIKAAIDHLRTRAEVKDGKIGVVGWCMGGKWAFRTAAEDARVVAAVGYYGQPPSDPAAIAKIQAAVMGHFGGDDKGPTPDQAKAFEAALQKAGKTVDIKIYPGAGHAFANVNNPWGGYREEAAKDAWARTLAFFAQHLKPAAKK
jgi:carboxymethylenebutenolidase